MNFDLPATIEPQVIQYAQEEQITPAEAIERLIQAGLNAQAQSVNSTKTPGEEMIGAFSSPEDVAIMNEAMQYVREMRAYDRPRDLIRAVINVVE